MQGTGGQRAWPGSGLPGTARGHRAGGPSGWVPASPPPLVFLPPVPKASSSRLGHHQLQSPAANALANPVTPRTIPSIPQNYRQSRRAGDRSLFAPVDRRVILQAAESSFHRHDSGGLRVCNGGTPARHNRQSTLRSPASRLEQLGFASLPRGASTSASRMARHTSGPSHEMSPTNTGRSRSGSYSHSMTRLNADSLFDELTVSLNGMNLMGDQRPRSVLPRLPTVEEIEGRTRRSSENSFLGVSAFPYTDARVSSSTREFPYVSALRRPGSNATDHRSHSYERRPSVSVVEERYMCSGNAARPRRSGRDSNDFLRSSGSNEGMTLFGDLFGDSFGSRMHRSAAVNMARSFLSSVAFPVSFPWRGPWEVRVGLSLPSGHRAEHQRHSRHAVGFPTPPLVLFAAASADPENFDILEHNIGQFIEEIERRFAFEDLDDPNAPFMLVVSGSDGGDGDDFVPHFWADSSGARVTLEQISEAQSLRDNLGQYTFKWTFGEAKRGDSHSTAASQPVKSPAGTGGGRAQQTQRSLGTSNSETPAATNSPAEGTQAETHNGYDCCVCLSAFEPGEALLTLRCLHIFHERCIDKWIKTSHSVKCPLCSTKIADTPSNDQNDGWCT